MPSLLSRIALVVALPLAVAACRQPRVQTLTVTERVDVAAMRAEPRTRLDSLRRTANQRSDSAGALVDTILVAPAQLTLRVGDSLQFLSELKLVARDRNGAEVRGYAPLYHVEPFKVAILRNRHLVAIDTGTATLFIRPMRFSATAPNAVSQSVTRVPVHVLAR